MALARIMPNSEGRNPFKRRITSRVVTSVLLYVCPIRSKALSVGTARMKLSSVYRQSTIRQISGFRTVSDEAILILAKTITIDILADEMRRVYFCRL